MKNLDGFFVSYFLLRNFNMLPNPEGLGDKMLKLQWINQSKLTMDQY